MIDDGIVFSEENTFNSTTVSYTHLPGRLFPLLHIAEIRNHLQSRQQPYHQADDAEEVERYGLHILLLTVQPGYDGAYHTAEEQDVDRDGDQCRHRLRGGGEQVAQLLPGDLVPVRRCV